MYKLVPRVRLLQYVLRTFAYSLSAIEHSITETYAVIQAVRQQLLVNMTKIDPLGSQTQMQNPKPNRNTYVAFAVTFSLLCFGFVVTHLRSSSPNSLPSTPDSEYAAAMQTLDGSMSTLGSSPVPGIQKSLLNFSPSSSSLKEFEQTEDITHSRRLLSPSRKVPSSRMLLSSKSIVVVCSQYDFNMN